ncbi:MAG: hypothetical protein CJBNEKGG_03399 [Prosthecobacter sp.]|nr:hypothetical protein [Prosthecobacter sp.]
MEDPMATNDQESKGSGDAKTRKLSMKSRKHLGVGNQSRLGCRGADDRSVNLSTSKQSDASKGSFL